MDILLTGANGFLGIHLARQLVAKNISVIATGKRQDFAGDPNPSLVYEKMDFTDPYAVHDLFEKYKPSVVVHAGAMTLVDLCEQEQWKAYTTNVEGTLTLLANAEATRAFFIFISTDFVFNGEKGFYTEEDQKDPVNFYGKTKAEAEEAVTEYEHDWAIVRTSLVYGKAVSGKHNIITLVKEKLEKGESYGLVNDQFRSPTWVEDLATGITLIIEKKATGIFNISGKDILTPYQVGKAVAAFLKADPGLIKEISAASFSQPARRPPKTNLVIEKAREELGYEPLGFEEGLRKTISLIT